MPRTKRSRTHVISRFFHADHVPYGLALARICMPLVMLIPMIQRIPVIREVFSADGAPVQTSALYGRGDLLPQLPGSLAVALYAVMLVLLVTSSLGWFTRFSLIGATSLFTYFNVMDAIGTMTKYSVIAVDVMVVLCMSQCGAMWSIDARKRRRSTGNFEKPLVPIWPKRLLQMLVGSMYFGAAMTKLHTPEFFSGDQLRFWMLTNLNFSNPVGEFVAMWPAILVLFAYITLVWEVLFIFMVWRNPWRLVILAVGALFHFMTCLTLGLYIFPLVCMAAYLPFVEDRDVDRVRVTLHRFWQRSRLPRRKQTAPYAFAAPLPQPAPRFPAPAMFGLILFAVAVAAVEIEYRYDPYGLRSGGIPLKEIPPERARQMIRSAERIRERDKFFSFDTGTFVVGGVLADSKRNFHYGDTMIAQCSLNPPHEDMWVECSLHDADGRLLDRNGFVVTREMLRCDFYYNIGEVLEPGAYDLIVRSGGQEIYTHRVMVEPDQIAATAQPHEDEETFETVTLPIGN